MKKMRADCQDHFRPKPTIMGLIGLICISFFIVAISNGCRRENNSRMTFPVVTEETRIVLKTSFPDARVIDLTGVREIVEAIGGLSNSSNLRGRSIGDTRVQGTIEIDGEVFTIDACMTAKGYCAKLDNDQRGEWQGELLGICLYRRFGYLPGQDFKGEQNPEKQ